MDLKILAIIRTTFMEVVRQPIFNVLTWSAFGLLALNPSIAAFSLRAGSDIKIMMDVGLSTLLLYGLFVSVFSAAGVITREIESFTVLTVISKPVSRLTFLVGKYLGMAGAVAVGYLFLSLVFIMTVRHGVMESTADKYHMPVIILGGSTLMIGLFVAFIGNFFYGWHFGAALMAIVLPLGTVATATAVLFDRAWAYAPPEAPLGDFQLLYALTLTFCAVLILSAFAVTFATRFSQVISLVLCAGVFVLGLLADHYFGSNLDQGLIYHLLYAAVPNFQFFWLGDALTQEITVAPSHVGVVAGYAVIYILAVLGLGVAMFQTREVG